MGGNSIYLIAIENNRGKVFKFKNIKKKAQNVQLILISFFLNYKLKIIRFLDSKLDKHNANINNSDRNVESKGFQFLNFGLAFPFIDFILAEDNTLHR